MKSLSVFAFLIFAITAQAEPAIEVSEFYRPAATEIRISFEDDGTGELEDFEIEASYTLTEDSWTDVTASVTISAVSQGKWLAVVPVDPAEPRLFLRVLKNGIVQTATFSAPTLELTEGELGTRVRVNLTTPYTGNLRYTLDGTPGVVWVDDAMSAFIPVPIADDAEAGRLKTIRLALELEGAGGASYALGTDSTATIIVEDNDAAWAGTLTLPDGGGETGIRVLVTEQSGVRTVCFKTDGGGLIPPSGGAPWLFSEFDLDTAEATFSANVSGVTIPAESTFYGADTTLAIAFSATGSEGVTADAISGTFTLNSTVSGMSHLDVPALGGTFSLFRKAGTAAPSSFDE
ncbi:MAG: hypothetical protein ACR2RV_02280 [Verrucomicrobiales bacterium]